MRSLKCVLTICGWFCFTLNPAAALVIRPTTHPGPTTSICLDQLTTRDGLSQNTVRCLLQDRKGFIWVGTLNGLNRYDGKKFIVYRPEYGNPHSISDTRIRELHEDPSGLIWVKTFEGRFHCFDPAQEDFIAYTQDATAVGYDQFFAATSGDIWLYGHNNGCLRVRRKGGKFMTQRYHMPGSQHVNFIFEDAAHTLWIGTTQGLYKTNGEAPPQLVLPHEDFIQTIDGLYFVTRNAGVYRYQQQQLRPQPMEKKQTLTCGALLNSHQLLLGTQDHGAWILDLANGQLSPAASIFGKTIPGHIDMATKPGKDIWINNHSGEIFYYDTLQQRARHFTLIPSQVMRLTDDDRFYIHQDTKSNTWITTYGGGLYCYNPHTDTLQHFGYTTGSSGGLSSNYLLSVLADRSGLVWIGTEHTGLNKLMPQSFTVSHIYPDEHTPRHYSANIVKTLFEDSRGHIWVSTKNGALHLYDAQLQKLRSLDHLFPQESTNVYCIQEDERGYIWLGAKGQGLYITHLDSLQKPARHFNIPDPAGTHKSNLVYAMVQDQQHRMWIGTFGAGLQLATYAGGNNISFRNFLGTHETLKDIRCLLKDRQGHIWAGTNNGLLSFDPQNPQAYQVYQSDLSNPNSLTSNVIKTMVQDRRGRLWVGTYGGGFAQFIPAAGKRAAYFTTYTTQQGLSHDIVNGMLEDEQGALWISTENGLTRFEPGKRTFEIFYFSNSTLGNLFAEAACCRRRNGQQLWGSMDGFYSCQPALMKTDPVEAPVVLTGFSIAGVSKRNGPAVSAAKELTLQPGQKVFSLEFASLAFRNPQQNKYTYILENYEDAWNPPAAYNMATYRNLPPGKYTFRVKGTNNDGSWSSQEAAIRIIVQPPFWRSLPAFILYGFIITALITGIRLVRGRIYQLQHAVALEKELTEYKLNFFTNISHEFRTPLSLIVSAMEQLLPGPQHTWQAGKHLHIMQKNVHRLLRLVDQLLDFRKLQHQRMKLQLRELPVITLLRELCDSFTDLAEQKQIRLQFNSNVTEYTMWVDENKLDKILYNLLSNAHKFTPAGGHIEVQALIDESSGHLQLQVSDSGIAIPESSREQVFQRFTQLNTTVTGTGIGLSLTKELVELLKGQISFRNNPDAGVTFIVTLPLSKTVYLPEELAAPDTNAPLFLQAAYIPDAADLELPDPSSRYRVLVIEDNPDICEYLAAQLGRYFHVHTAPDGREGLATAIDTAPDLVVCDVMLPEMNGFEITRRIRNEFQTCHIPVVLLTALSSGEHQLQGLDAGADAYISKPFSTRLLLTTVIRIIEQREKIRKRFSNDPGFFEVTIAPNEADRKFLDRLHFIIAHNLDNAQFSVDEFAAAVKLGRTLFYKKVKGLTGYSPNEYIRLVRLKKAAELLHTGEYTVAEVTYKVGMNDPFYFSKCFKAQFGVPPSAYVKQVKAG